VFYSFLTCYKKRTHQEEIAGPDTSRRKKLRPTARPRCLVDWALHRSTEHASQWHSVLQLHLHRPLQFTADHQPVSRAPSSTSSLAAHCTPLHHTVSRASRGTSSLTTDRRPLHYTAALPSDCSQHRWGRSSNMHN